MRVNKITTTTNLVDQEQQKLKRPLRFTATQRNSTIKLVASNSAGISNKIKIKYYDSVTQTWNYFINKTAESVTVTLANIDDYIQLVSQTNRLSISATQYYQFYMTGQIKASGNTMSLVKYKRFLEDYQFYYLFYYCGSLITSPELPCKKLASYCYSHMFHGTNIVITPKLPANILFDYCYSHMFRLCSNLITIQSLPATILAIGCYSDMFLYCNNLINVPELPATTLANNCYYNMFRDCTSLVNAPELPATTLANICYCNMFNGCRSLTEAPELPATNLANGCYNGMFWNCTSLVSASDLPATNLAADCYTYMFMNCTNLKNIPSILPATTLASLCYACMFNGCTSLVSAPELPATTLVYACYQNTFTNCTNLSSINVSFTYWIDSSIVTLNWLSNASPTGTFICPSDLPQIRDNSHIPPNWTIVRK